MRHFCQHEHCVTHWVISAPNMCMHLNTCAPEMPCFLCRLFTKFPDEELARLKDAAGISVDPLQLLSSILDAIPASVPLERTLLFFPGPFNSGCDAGHKWMAQATTLAIEWQASCGPRERTIIVSMFVRWRGTGLHSAG